MPALFRTVVTCILLLAFTCQTFSRAFIVFDYYANREKYAAHCINKSWPKMRCHGNCQMVKKLEKEEQKESQQPARKLQEKNEVVYIPGTYFLKLTFITNPRVGLCFGTDIHFPQGFANPLLRPPIGLA